MIAAAIEQEAVLDTVVLAKVADQPVEIVQAPDPRVHRAGIVDGLGVAVLEEKPVPVAVAVHVAARHVTQVVDVAGSGERRPRHVDLRVPAVPQEKAVRVAVAVVEAADDVPEVVDAERQRIEAPGVVEGRVGLRPCPDGEACQKRDREKRDATPGPNRETAGPRMHGGPPLRQGGSGAGARKSQRFSSVSAAFGGRLQCGRIRRPARPPAPSEGRVRRASGCRGS